MFVTYVKKLDRFRTAAYELNPVQARVSQAQRSLSARGRCVLSTAVVCAVA